MPRSPHFRRRALAAFLTLLPVVLAVVAWERRSWQPRFLKTGGEVRSLAWSPDGKRLAVGVYFLGRNLIKGETPYSREGELQLWNVRAQRREHVLVITDSVDGCLFSPTGRSIVFGNAASGRENGVHLADVQSGRMTHSLRTIWPVAFSRDANILQGITASQNRHEFAVTQWNAHTGRAIQHRRARFPQGFGVVVNSTPTRVYGSPVFPLFALSSDGRWGATVIGKLRPLHDKPPADQNETDQPVGVLIFNARTGKQHHFLPLSPKALWVSDITFPTNNTVSIREELLTNDNIGLYRFRRWDLTSKRLTNNVVEHQWVRGAFSPDGSLIAIWQCDNQQVNPVVEIQIKSALPGRHSQLLCTLRGHSATVTHATFSPDSRTLATGDEAGNVLLWRLK